MTGVVMTLVGGYLDVSGATVGRWVWIVGLFVVLLVAPFLAWREATNERAQAQQKLGEFERLAKPSFRFGDIDTHDYVETGGNYHGRAISVVVENDSNSSIAYRVCVSMAQAERGRRVSTFRSGWLGSITTDNAAVLSVGPHERAAWCIVFRFDNTDEKLIQVNWGNGLRWGSPNQLRAGVYFLELRAEAVGGTEWGAVWVRLDLHNMVACFVEAPPLVNVQWREGELLPFTQDRRA
jgi:hypothetical protein